MAAALRASGYVTVIYIYTYRRSFFTWVSEGSSGTGARVRAAVMTEEVRMERSGPVTELELDLGRTGEVRETGLLVVHRAGAHVQRESAHLPRAPVERPAAHRRQLFQTPFFAPLVLEPHLRGNGRKNHVNASVLHCTDIISRCAAVRWKTQKRRKYFTKARAFRLFFSYVICQTNSVLNSCVYLRII